LQDRLVQELPLADIASITAAQAQLLRH